MAYSKTTWETGDVITAELLNHAEDGIAAASAAKPIVTAVFNSSSLGDGKVYFAEADQAIIDAAYAAHEPDAFIFASTVDEYPTAYILFTACGVDYDSKPVFENAGSGSNISMYNVMNYIIKDASGWYASIYID